MGNKKPPPDQSRLLTDFRSTVIDHLGRCGADNDNDYHADRICAKFEVVCQQKVEALIEEIENERFAEPQYVPASGREPIIICLTEKFVKALKATHCKEKKG